MSQALALLALAASALLAEELKYQRAPAEVRAVLDAPATPTISLSPTRDRLVVVQAVRYPPLADLAEPSLGLAGFRVNPVNNGPSRPPRYVSLTLKPLPEGRERRIQVSANSKIGFPEWSPDGKQFAFARFAQTAVELWVADATSGAAKKLKSIALNGAFGDPFAWMPDSQTILCKLLPDKRGKPPGTPRVPAGPVTQESSGHSSIVRTYQDLLDNPFEEAQFDFYATSQLALVNTRTEKVTPVGAPAIFSSVDASPDGEHILVERIARPYSYLLPMSGFPKRVEVWSKAGKLELKLADLPEQGELPPGGVATGPRKYHWRPTATATLVWVEALDGGDPKKKVAHRDRVVTLRAPFTGAREELALTEHRFSALSWGEKGFVALLRDYQSSKKWSRTFLINPDNPSEAPKLLWSRSTQDRYSDPGAPLMKNLATGQRAMRVQDNALFLVGLGASAEGERPFLDRFDLGTMQAERLFQCDAESYESVIALVKDDASLFITRHESPTEPPNYFIRTPHNVAKIALTKFPDPAPQLRAIKKQLMTYEREDGVQLSATLYLPPDYQPGTALPTVLWAYPREFNDADTAGQIAGSTNRFTILSGTSHLFFALHGYAVIDGATMPVVGDPKKANDTYLEQIVASAKAAVQEAVKLGVTDEHRVGVMGHSYGAFMTANLLAHSELFRAGVARSGAYNRTLTPFGFQNETRTLWQAPDMYLKNSAFLSADKIKEPLLLIHGEADNNPGTFPLQSERMFQAVKGNGGTVRFVLLPHESHAYEARESVEHVIWEMFHWFDRYVKNAGEPKGSAASEK
ncbi:MAG: prolyl oligopeptidase family serine peptidase [Verrucomicrobia bacterium]|nr:prolyl oligopeptidase family serine peptidase [Verrucomicrobiota bacterium]